MEKMKTYFTRMGDGSGVHMTEGTIREDLEAGTREAARCGKIPKLSKDELDYLYEIIVTPTNVIGVKRGMEVVTTSESGCFKLNYQAHIPMDRTTSALVNERVLCLDSVDIGNIDYSYRSVKPILHDEAKIMEMVQSQAIFPVLYGGMPDLGRYTKPNGPVDNWSELLPLGKINEARAAQEEAVEYAVKDLVYIAEGMIAAGADGMLFDTCGASGDADFLAALKAIELIKQKFPDFGIEIGMAGEFVMGMHGNLKYEGTRLAGLYPHKQVKQAEKAGANIFSPVINTNSNMSFPWNISRAVTFVKACVEDSNIPIHPNMGMGMGGTPMTTVPAVDAASRAVKAMVEIAKIDGLLIGTGDPFGNEAIHETAAGMGGIRTAGDLVLRLQLAKSMRLIEAKKYVAEKLGVTPIELCDCLVMQDIRETLDIGYSMPTDGAAKGIEAKFRIADILDIKINSVERFKRKILKL